MALGPALRSALTRIAGALDDFASKQGWNPGEYKILFRVQEEWGRISVYFIIKDFCGLSDRDIWVRIWNHLERAGASGPDLGYSVGLSVHDWEQVNQGGIYTIPPSYVEDEELLPNRGRRD